MSGVPEANFVVHWNTHPPRNVRVHIEHIESFSARGMQRVYGRSDRFLARAALHMDIWRNSAGQLFARFWSRRDDTDDLSLIVRGIKPESLSERDREVGFSDRWIPGSLRKEYEQWLTSEL